MWETGVAVLSLQGQAAHLLSLSLQNVRIDPSSIAFNMWRDIPVPFYLTVNLFEVQNPQEVLQGAKPKVTQRGPYVYRSGTACGPAVCELLCCLPDSWLAPPGGQNGNSAASLSLMAQDFKAIQM